MITEDNFVKHVTRAINSRKTPEGVAKAVHKVCQQACKDWGMKPNIETFCRQHGKIWKVSFEAGPYQWAIAANMSHQNNKVLTEPYWSFDLDCSAN
jgi:hypothetical protein